MMKGIPEGDEVWGSACAYILWSSEAELLALPMAMCCTIAHSHIEASDCGSTKTLSVALHAV